MINKQTSNFIWNSIENLSIQLIQFIVGICMARVLSPDDYGLVGILWVFIAICNALMNGGFSSALIQKSDRTNTDLSTVFYFNIVISIILYVILYISAPYIAWFWKRPILEDLIKVIAIPLIFNSLILVQRTILTIEMNFKVLAKIAMVSSIIQGFSGIAFAYSGFGVWSIAWSMVIGSAVSCALSWTVTNWYPLLIFSKQSFKTLFSYGSKLLASTLLDTIWNNLYPIVIGKFFPASILGYFTRAMHYSLLPANTLSGVIGRVSFPLLCDLQNNDIVLKRTYCKLIRIAAFITFPIMIGIASIAQPLITTMLTDKWASCVPYLQILAIVMMFYPIHALNLNLLQAKGRSDLFLEIELTKKFLGALILIVTLQWGIIALCWGLLFHSLLSLAINSFYNGKLFGLGLKVQIKLFAPIILTSAFMGLVVQVIVHTTSHPFWQLTCGIIGGCFSYVFISFILNKEEITYIIDKLKTKS